MVADQPRGSRAPRPSKDRPSARSAGRPHDLFASGDLRPDAPPPPVDELPPPDLETRALPLLAVEATLQVESGAHKGKVIDLGAGTASIGRSSKCELSLKRSAGVSRRHCKIQYVDGRFVVFDLESRNGTLVNGRQVSRHILADGDLIEISDERVRFRARPRRGAKDAPVLDDVPTALFVPEAAPPAPAPPPKRAAAPSPPAVEPDTARLDPELVRAVREAPPPRPRRAEPPPPLPPPSARSMAPTPRAPELSTPYQHHAPPARTKSKAPVAAVVVVLLGVGAVVAFDVMRERSLILAQLEPLLDRSVAVVAPPGSAPLTPPTTTTAPAAVEPVAAAPVEPALAAAPVVPAPVVPAVAAAPVEPAPVEPAVAAAPVEPVEAAPVVAEKPSSPVRAGAFGRVAKVAVAEGDRVGRGVTLVVIEAQATQPKKLAALRDEEAAFAAALKKGKTSVKDDLDDVRREIAALERRARSVTVSAPATGVVAKVNVRVGQTVKSADVVIELQ